MCDLLCFSVACSFRQVRVVLGDDWALGYPCVCVFFSVCVCLRNSSLVFYTHAHQDSLSLWTWEQDVHKWQLLCLLSCSVVFSFFSILKLEQNFQNVNKPTGGVSHTLPCSRQFFFRLPVLVNNTHWFSELISVISDIHHFATRCRKSLKWPIKFNCQRRSNEGRSV